MCFRRLSKAHLFDCNGLLSDTLYKFRYLPTYLIAFRLNFVLSFVRILRRHDELLDRRLVVLRRPDFEEDLEGDVAGHGEQEHGHDDKYFDVGAQVRRRHEQREAAEGLTHLVGSKRRLFVGFKQRAEQT